MGTVNLWRECLWPKMSAPLGMGAGAILDILLPILPPMAPAVLFVASID